MKINFTVSTKANQFYFIQNLSEWHFSCRKSYNKEWLKQTGPLTTQEQNALNKLREILRKYSFNKLNDSKAYNVPDYFFRFEEIDDKKSPVSDSEMKTYLQVMDVLKPRFERIWQKQSNNFERVTKQLQEKFNKTEQKVENDLQVLFINLQLPSEVFFYLLLSTDDRGGGGGANNGPNRITLECSSTKPVYINEKLSVIWHELAHILLPVYLNEVAGLLDNDHLIKQILSEKADKVGYEYSKELLTFSIFTSLSYLTGKYFPTEMYQKTETAIKKKDYDWLLQPRYIFPIYLLYLNGQFLRSRLGSKERITPTEMAEAIVNNHVETIKLYRRQNRNLSWLNYK